MQTYCNSVTFGQKFWVASGKTNRLTKCILKHFINPTDAQIYNS